MKKEIKLEVNVNLKDFVDQWARQAGYYCSYTSKDYAQQQYLNALKQLFNLFCNHHKELDDSSFIRIFRFFAFMNDEMEIPEDIKKEIEERKTKLKRAEPEA